MVLTKVWLQTEIDSEPNPAIKLALERIFSKYTEAPIKGESDNITILKDFDGDAVYSKIVHYYIDEKGYSLKDAEVVAIDVVLREKERRNIK